MSTEAGYDDLNHDGEIDTMYADENSDGLIETAYVDLKAREVVADDAIAFARHCAAQ